MKHNSNKTIGEDRKKVVGRRHFLSSTALLGGCGFLAGTIAPVFSRLAHAQRMVELDRGEHEYHHNDPDHTIYSTCLQCQNSCAIKCKVVDGVLVKIDGNPRCPQNCIPNVRYTSSPEDAAPLEGKICPKGQAGIDTLYDPYRLRKVLKRKPGTPRGGGQWISIGFNAAIKEIVEGGDLFGEGHVQGLNDVYALRDRSIAKAMAEDVAKIKKKAMTVEEFKSKHASNLGVLIDTDHPDLGPKNNQFVFLAGRIQYGRDELMKWFTHNSFGSINAIKHTSVGELSHHMASALMSDKWEDGKWRGGKTHFKPDAGGARFIIFFGTGFSEANFGPPLLSQLISENVIRNGLKIAVLDPRLSRSAGKADWWIPIKPGTDGAFALGMARWIIDNDGIDRRFLENANAAAAKVDGETAWSTAAYLVKIDQGHPARYLRADEVGIGTKLQFVVSRGGNLLPVDPNDKEAGVEGDLDAKLDKGGVVARTAFGLFRERAREMTLAKYAEVCGVAEDTIVEMAREFTSYGKQAVTDFFSGPSQHTNGYYNCQAIMSLNLLVGNIGWKGGLAQGGGRWHEFGGSPGNPYDFQKLHPNRFPTFGLTSTREKAPYEESTLFNGYPAKRPWYPVSMNIYHEVIPSAADAYPYPIKVLFLQKGTPVMSSPAGHKQIAILRDPKKIPLFVACDIVIGETSMYADYIFPDTTYLERWGTPHAPPSLLTAVNHVRQPVVAPSVETATVDGIEMPINMEAFLIAVAKKLGLPGFGKDAFGPGKHFNHQDDWFLKAVANIAMGDKKGDSVPAAEAKELELFLRARRHLPKTVFDEERWTVAAGKEHWPHVVYVLNRGGRFEDSDKMYKGRTQSHPLSGILQLFVEKVAQSKNSMSGQSFDGLPRVEETTFADGRAVPLTADYPFHLITYKEIFGTQTRTTPSNLWLNELMPENAVLMNRRDAEKMGLRAGDRVRLASATNPDGTFDVGNGEIRRVEGKVKVVEGLRPGVVAVSWHFGHWASGSRDAVIDGKPVKGDPTRARGFTPNPVMLEDTAVGNVCLTDPIGGSSANYGTHVKIMPV
ncbi:MAG: molybdopterin-dependent oxidoreductase [Thermodesulfobacteriota bacterium]